MLLKSALVSQGALMMVRPAGVELASETTETNRIILGVNWQWKYFNMQIYIDSQYQAPALSI